MATHRYTSEQMELVYKLINNTPFIYYIIDKDWKFILSEGKGLEAIGLKPGQVIGMSLKDLYADDQASLDAFQTVFNGKALVTQTSAHGMDFETFHSPWFNKDGEVELVTCISTDVTKHVEIQNEILELNKTLEKKVDERTIELSGSNKELTVMNEEIRAVNKQLQDNNETIINMQKQLVESEKMAALGNLVAGVAHEVNTPIGVSITAATHLSELASEILKKKAEGVRFDESFDSLLEDMETATNMISRNLIRAGELVQSFKQLSVDQITEEKREFALGGYIDEIILSLSPIYKKTNVSLEYKCHDQIKIDGWPGALAQIITNLLFNAIQHGYDENETGVINVDVYDDSDYVKIIFKDDGKGISAENVSKIFDPFYTTIRDKGGTGLGLSILFSLVTQKFGGTITCDSKVGEGTEFTIQLAKNL